MHSDEQIAKNNQMHNISQIAASLGIKEQALISYGKYKAKIDIDQIPNHHNAKVILVTAINPTPAGEGKTTVTIGLADALAKLNKKSIALLREPSLGPVFGIKGGATGGGYAQVVPMTDINLHFTGDLHAITCANNLLAALIDNHIYQGNELGIERVTWRRVLDINDRQLRHITSGLGKKTDGVARDDGFDITVASEVMAIFCLAQDLADLKSRLGDIIIGYKADDTPIFAKDLQAQGAMTTLLKEAFLPNLVQTLEKTPALIHGGPFANIAHGCNSVIATKSAMGLADFVVTEAGFGADLGGEKFCDIKCRSADITPSACVIVATVRALKYGGGATKETLNSPNLEALQQGLPNLMHHIDTMQQVFGMPVVVAINHFAADNEAEIALIQEACHKKDVQAVLCRVWECGSEGGVQLAQAVLTACDKATTPLQYAYEADLPIIDKINTLAKRVYGAKAVQLSDAAQAALTKLQKLDDNKHINLKTLPICMAKTQYSLSDDPKKLGTPKDFVINVQDIGLSNGARFLVVICGNIMKMPGLPKSPAAQNIDVVNDAIVGLF